MKVVNILVDGSKTETIKDRVVKIPTRTIKTNEKTRLKSGRDNF